MNILFLSRWFPSPPNNGSKLRIHNLLQGMCGRHRVTLLSFFDPREGRPTGLTNGSGLHDLRIAPWKEFDGGWRTLPHLLSTTPRSVTVNRSSEMENLIAEVIDQRTPDLVIASQLSMASYWRCFRGIPALFEEAELGLYRQISSHGKTVLSQVWNRLTWLKHRRYVAQTLGRFRACTVASDCERDLLREVVPEFGAVEVIPNFINLEEYRSSDDAPIPDTLIFTGSFRYAANYEAMCWFVGEVLPLLRAQRPSVRLRITGDTDGRTLPVSSGVELTGQVEDVKTLITGSCVSIVPLLEGGGTRLKIPEAMALRRPVVATSKGCEGLNVKAGRHLLIADTPEEFAAAVTTVLKDPGLRSRLVENAYRLIRENYDRSTVVPRFLTLIEGIADV